MTMQVKSPPRKKQVIIDRLPPHSTEAEQGVLGCALISPDNCLPEIRAKVKSHSAFYELRHQILFDGLAAMCHAGTPIDSITFRQFLKDQGLLDEIGGDAYLAQLQDAVPSAANLTYYLDILREKHELRRMVQTCTDVVTRIHDYTGTIDDLKFSVQSDLGEVFGNSTGGLSEKVEARLHRADVEIPRPASTYSINGITIATAGNIETISGPAKSGKTSLKSGLIASTYAAPDGRY